MTDGPLLRLEVGPVAHGGHCVARHQGRVVFVRHALPGEIVLARLEAAGAGDRFWRADAVEVVSASPHRVVPPCPLAGPGGCGGCDWQHVAPAEQRRLKAAVLLEQLTRLGRVDPAQVPGLAALVVEPVAVSPDGTPDGPHAPDGPDGPDTPDGTSIPADDGLGWRTRVRFAVDDAGRPGLRRHRSHDVVPVRHCPIAHPEVNAVGVGARTWRGAEAVEVVAAGPERLVLVEQAPGARVRIPELAAPAALALRTPDGLDRLRGRTWVQERVVLDGEPRTFRVTGSGFWQVHPGAPGALAAAVLAAADPRPGERAADLYSGVGLFTAALAQRVGVTGSVLGIESDPRAAADARRNLHDLPQVSLQTGRVERVLPRLAAEPAWRRIDVVVLDPPRSGAGRDVMQALLGTGPRVVVYVACDPAALARDVAIAAASGYRLAGVRAFDLFPHTQHLECVATLVPAGIS